MSLAFPQFTRFIPEVRALIWEATLPVDAGALYCHNMNWFDHQIEPMSWPSDVPKESLADSLKPPSVEVPVPVAYRVCKEARSLVERWINKNKLEWCYCEDKSPVLIRTFDADRDLFYMHPYRWDFFAPHLPDPDDARQRALVARVLANIKHLAIPALVAYFEVSTVVNFLSWTKNLETIYVIWDELPQGYTREGRDLMVELNEPVQRRWEIASYPKLRDEVHIYHPRINGRRDHFDDGVLEELLDDIEDRFMTTDVDPEIMDEDGEQLRFPRFNVTVKNVPSWY